MTWGGEVGVVGRSFSKLVPVVTTTLPTGPTTRAVGPPVSSPPQSPLLPARARHEARPRAQPGVPSPKKRDLPVCSSGGDGGGGEEPAHSSDSAGRDTPAGASASGEWMRVQSGMHYSMASSDGVGVPVDQYGMLYKVALPSAAYSPASLHPVLGHISPAYTVPSSLLQHPGIPYPPLGGHHIPHLVPYPSVIQGGVVSPPPQPAPSGPAVRQHLELNPRVAPPVFYHHHTGCRADYRDPHPEREKEVNGGEEEEEEEEEERGGREPAQDRAYSSRGPRVLHAAPPGSMEAERPQDRAARRFEARGSPGHRNTPDTDLEWSQRADVGVFSRKVFLLLRPHFLPNFFLVDCTVQQVVARLASPNQVVTGSHKEASLGPLNLSQGSQREREAQLGVRGEDVFVAGRTAYAAHLAAHDDPRLLSQHQQPAHHAVLLANGQPVLVPLEYQQQHYPGPPNDVGVSSATAPPKASEPPGRAVPERPEPSPAPGAVQAAVAPPPGPSHFTKGAIIQLATGELKRVEDLQTQDFVRSAEASGGLKIDSSMVVDVRKSQRPGLVALYFTVGEQQSKVAIDVPPEHPFFVFGQGWSSCSPDRTAQLYGLDCHHLQAGDVCVSITLQQHRQQQQQQQQPQSRASSKASSASSVAFQPMGPPAPQHPRPPAHFRGERTHRDREEEQPMQVGAAGHGEAPPRPDRTSAEHTRSRSEYHLHTEGPQGPGAGASSLMLTAAAHRRWSAPGFQKYQIKSEEDSHPSASTASSRPSFIPQEVKLSIEGRSNAGK
ncbi:hypothetical protein SKAU_G00345910 [Synaphobranchus kaupii]|uniref:AXH domain-containing protein n=1 Tax=Synaphobranchus kaupii TaxID=118154 RepID=A0A9Q1IFJ4_SYNKA|nr:hypothetical protein SKAU_G00345910 [Synaphobranchus kaupii]